MHYFLINWQPSVGQSLTPHRRFTITLRQTTLVRTPLVEWSTRHRDLFLKTHYKRDGHSCPRRDLNPQSQRTNSAVDPHLRPWGHWEPQTSAQRTKIFRTSKSAKTYEYVHCLHVQDEKLHCLKIHGTAKLRIYKYSSQCIRLSL